MGKGGLLEAYMQQIENKTGRKITAKGQKDVVAAWTECLKAMTSVSD